MLISKTNSGLKRNKNYIFPTRAIDSTLMFGSEEMYKIYIKKYFMEIQNTPQKKIKKFFFVKV